MQFSLSHPAYILPGIVTAIGCELIIDCVNRVEQTAFVVPANTYETWEESYFTEEKAERMGVRSHRFHSFSPGCLGTSVILFVLCVLGLFLFLVFALGCQMFCKFGKARTRHRTNTRSSQTQAKAKIRKQNHEGR